MNQYEELVARWRRIARELDKAAKILPWESEAYFGQVSVVTTIERCANQLDDVIKEVNGYTNCT